MATSGESCGRGSMNSGLGTRDSGLGSRESGVGSRESGRWSAKDAKCAKESMSPGARRMTGELRHPGAIRRIEPGIHFPACGIGHGDQRRVMWAREHEPRDSGLGTRDSGLGEMVREGREKRKGKHVTRVEAHDGRTSSSWGDPQDRTRDPFSSLRDWPWRRAACHVGAGA